MMRLLESLIVGIISLIAFCMCGVAVLILLFLALAPILLPGLLVLWLIKEIVT